MPIRTEQHLLAAIEAANPHDEIRIGGVIHVNAPIMVRKPLRLTGEGDAPKLVFRGLMQKGEGMLTTFNDVTIRDLEFHNARALTGNGAGIWHERGHLRIDRCTFSGNQNGLMAGGLSTDKVEVARSKFIGNGAGCGHTHGIYVTAIADFLLYDSSFEQTRVGHDVKSRAAKTIIRGNYFAGCPTTTTSCAIDIPNGGNAIISRNLMVKGAGSMSRTFVSYCAERKRQQPGSLLVETNIFINHRVGCTIGVTNYSLFTKATLENNAFENVTLAALGRWRENTRQNAQVAIACGLR